MSSNTEAAARSGRKGTALSKGMVVLLFSLLFHFSSFGQSTGQVKGKIMTSDSLSAEFVTVGLKGTSKGAMTDADGDFLIDHVLPGTYTLLIQIVGYETIEQPLEVTAGETTRLGTIRLKEDAKTLHEVTVEGKKNPFANKESEQVARLPLKNIENPQVYSVVTTQLMEQQVTTNISDALKNAPGTLVVSYPSGGLGVLSRGFKIGINARNGLETATGRAGTDFITAERIEVIKGPSGTLFGASITSFGGLVNMVSKRPYETFGGNVSYSLGSWGLNRFTADVNLPVTKERTALFRFNGALHQEGSFKTYGYNNTFTIAPSFLFKVNSRLTLFADVEIFNADQTRNVYSRFPAATGFNSMDDVPLDYNQSVFLDDANALTRTSKYFLDARYKINERWTSTTSLSFVNERVKQSYQYYNNWLDNSRIARTVLLYGPINNSYTNIQQNFNGDFKTGFIRHRLLVGGNYRYYYGDGAYTVPYNLYPTSGPVVSKNIDTINVYGSYRPLTKSQIDNAYATAGSVGPFGITKQKTYSAYISDVINFTPKLSTMLSLRYDHFEQTRIATGPTVEYQQDALSPKLGIVYQVVQDQFSIFGNYTNGFQNNAPVVQDGGVLVLKPTYANQWEAGFKFDAFGHRLTSTISYYNIAIENAVRADAGRTYQDGNQLSKGVEVEVIANPVTGLNLLAGYAYNENTYVRAAAAIEGKTATDAPHNIANGWISYTFQNTFLKNFGVGAGFNYADKSYFDAANTFIMPSYTIYNATVFYDHAKFRIGVKMNNISDEKYWDLWGTPQNPRQLIANVSYKF